jgi:predicted dehydrogenase
LTRTSTQANIESVLDSFIHVLGDFTDIKAHLHNNFPTVPVLDMEGQVVNPAHPRSSPDHIFVQGTLENGCLASIAYRKSKAAVDGVGYRWYITGTDGEIEVRLSEGHWQFNQVKKSLRLKVGTEETQEIEFLAKDDYAEANVKAPGTNTARQYQGFAKGDTEACATFESALKTHRLLDKILKSAGWESV